MKCSYRDHVGQCGRKRRPECRFCAEHLTQLQTERITVQIDAAYAVELPSGWAVLAAESYRFVGATLDLFAALLKLAGNVVFVMGLVGIAAVLLRWTWGVFFN